MSLNWCDRALLWTYDSKAFKPYRREFQLNEMTHNIVLCKLFFRCIGNYDQHCLNGGFDPILPHLSALYLLSHLYKMYSRFVKIITQLIKGLFYFQIDDLLKGSR